MIEFNISYDIEKDADNYLNTLYGKCQDRSINGLLKYGFVSPFLVKEIEKSQSKEDSKNQILKELNKWQNKNQIATQLNKDILFRLWDDKKETYIKMMEKFYNKSINWSKIDIFFTTLTKCPSNFKGKWFMVPIRLGFERQIAEICHKLFFFSFFENYYSYCEKKLDAKEINHIRRSLTVFLDNKPFSDIISVYDGGYQEERELRNFLWNEYSKNPDNFNFQDLLDKAIEQVKLDENLKK